jgi:simple sugar transport system substrate-binding protein
VRPRRPDTGANVSIIYSDWDFDRMITQLRDIIGQAPDGIAMMGHPGDAAILPLAEQAAAAGIRMMYMNVDVPEVRARTGAGYVGARCTTRARRWGPRRCDWRATACKPATRPS